jgi:hypothetical protein
MESLEPRTLLAFSGLPLQLGGDGFDMGKRIVATTDGGYIEAGIFSGTIDFDPRGSHARLTSLGDTDIFLARYNSASHLVWVKRIGGTEFTDEISKQDTIDIAADPKRAGDLFVNGVSADPLLAAELVTDLAIGPDGGVFLTGEFIGPVDFDPGPGRTIFNTFDDNYYDGFVLKLSGNGNFVWAKQIGDRFTNTVNGVAFDASGNVFLTGLFSRNQVFPGASPSLRIAQGRADGYVLKMNSAGDIQWMNQFGSDGTSKPEIDGGRSIAVDSAGNVYVGGTYAGDATFTSTGAGAGTILTGEKRTDAFVAKYSNAGSLIKVVGFTGRGYDGISAVAVDSHSNVVVAGYFQGDSFAPNPARPNFFLPEPIDIDGNSTEITDLFVEKLSSNLTTTWIQRLRGTGTEFADQIRIDSSDNIIIGGSWYGLARFGSNGPRLISGISPEDFGDENDSSRDYSYDAYLWKMNSAGSTLWVRPTGSGSDDFGAGVAITSNDSVLFTGRFRASVDFDPRHTVRRLRAGGLADIFVTGYDANGKPLF